LLVGHKITKQDFVEAFHQTVFVAINNLFSQGAVKLDQYIINDYLKNNFQSLYKIYTKNQGDEYVEKAKELATPENFNANYQELKKFSLLRRYLKAGIEVDEIFDPTEEDTEVLDEQRYQFSQMSIDDILNYFRKKLSAITEEYSTKNGRDSIKAGSDEGKKQKEEWKKTPAFGLSYASNYLTTVTRGIQPRKFVLGSAASGTGKTRITVANICHTFAPKYWDSKVGEFVDNPNGTQNAALYIGTEMELVQEIEPILWAYMADVPQGHITSGQYVGDEEERVDEAIRILHDEGHIYLEYIPDYDLATLENVIEQHVLQHNVRHVFFDYIHITTDLIGEFQSNAKAKMQIREDQVLANLGLKLKELTRKYDISIDSWTQVSGDFKNSANQDQTIIRGSKALADKIDTGYIVSMVNMQDLKKLEKIMKSRFLKWQPNRCITVYKNRGGEYTKCKIWVYIEYSTMRVHDLFCTDEDYQILDMPQTFTRVREDQKVVFSTSKEELFGQMIEDTVDITETALAEESSNAFEDTEEIEKKIAAELDKDNKKEDNEDENEPFWEDLYNKKLEAVVDPDDNEEEKASRTESEEFDF
jgi:replicative DNA helicase